MYALLFCLVAVVAITAERFLYYRQVTMEFSMIVHTYFAQRLDGFFSDIEQVANYIVNDLPAFCQGAKRYS